jgi:hypothetical protein
MQDSEDTPQLPASPSDHTWYHSEGDAQPMDSRRPRLPIKLGEGGGQEAESGPSGMSSVTYYARP